MSVGELDLAELGREPVKAESSVDLSSQEDVRSYLSLHFPFFPSPEVRWPVLHELPRIFAAILRRLLGDFEMSCSDTCAVSMKYHIYSIPTSMKSP